MLAGFILMVDPYLPLESGVAANQESNVQADFLGKWSKTSGCMAGQLCVWNARALSVWNEFDHVVFAIM